MNTLARSRLYVLFCHLSTIPVLYILYILVRVCVYMHHTEKAPEKQISYLISPYYHPDQYNSAQTTVVGEGRRVYTSTHTHNKAPLAWCQQKYDLLFSTRGSSRWLLPHTKIK